jgi:hypothetical protein
MRQSICGTTKLQYVHKTYQLLKPTSRATHPYAHMSAAGEGFAEAGTSNSGLMYRTVPAKGDELDNMISLGKSFG